MILGVIRGILPDERTAILRLQVNFLGVIDFEQERFSFDASLFDSKLLSFTLDAATWRCACTGARTPTSSRPSAAFTPRISRRR